MIQKAIIKRCDIVIVENSTHPIRISLDMMIFGDQYYDKDFDENICFYMTEYAANKLSDALSKHNEYILFFSTEPHMQCSIRWDSSNTISFNIGYYDNLRYEEYLLSRTDTLALSVAINSVIRKPDVVSENNIDSLAGARERMNKNLMDIFT